MKVILPQRNSRTDLFFDIQDFICAKNVIGACCILWEVNVD